jgi:hypothetical protein
LLEIAETGNFDLVKGFFLSVPVILEKTLLAPNAIDCSVKRKQNQQLKYIDE